MLTISIINSMHTWISHMWLPEFVFMGTTELVLLHVHSSLNTFDAVSIAIKAQNCDTFVIVSN